MPALIRNSFLMFLFSLVCATAGEGTGPIPPAELAALDRAISRELNSSHLGSQTLGDLRRLRQRLVRMQSERAAPTKQETTAERQAALQPLDGDDSQRRQLERLLQEAETGSRSARRSLALYYLYMNDPEKAQTQWRLMGKATEADLPYLLISAYLDLALGEYNSGRNNLETALRLMDTRTTLALSKPQFCLNVGGYRVYTPRDQSNLLPGEEVLIYVEVEGADFYTSSDGGRECRLMFGLTLKNDAQYTLWAEPKYGEYSPQFSGPVRDLHAALTWRIPNELQPGRYHLHLEAVEQVNLRRGESVLSFNVGKRETNPEKRITSEAGRADVDRAVRESNRIFDGGLNPPPAPSVPGSEYQWNRERGFELQRDYYRNQKVE